MSPSLAQSLNQGLDQAANPVSATSYHPPVGVLKPLWHVARISRGQTGWLVLGILFSLVSTATAIGLMTGTGLLIGGLAFPLWILAMLGPARVILRYMERLLTHDAMFRALTDLRVWFFRGLAAQSGGGLGFRRAGDMLSRLASDVSVLDGVYLRLLIPGITALAIVPGLVWFFVVRHAIAYGPVVIGLFLAAILIVPTVAAIVSYRTGSRLAETNAGLLVTSTDLAFGLREIRAFGAEARIKATLQTSEKRLLEAQFQLAQRSAWIGAGWVFFTQASILAVLLGAYRHPGFAASSVFLLVICYEILSTLPRAGSAAGHQAAAAQRVLEAAGGGKFATGLTPRPAGRAATELSFENIRFRWASDRPLVFDGLTMKIPAGSRIAVLGPSGIGKSTLAALALKVAEPESGRIMMAGKDIADMPPEEIRNRISWVSQQTHLFEDTIRANLKLGDPSATDNQLWTALDQAAIGDFVRGLPGALDYFVGESGSGFSGGQGRRLALARALLSSAPIMILDEPCAGLDIATAYEFTNTLNALPAGRTMILITHHLTGTEQLDYVWVYRPGKRFWVSHPR